MKLLFLFVVIISLIFVQSKSTSTKTTTKTIDPIDEFTNPILKIVKSNVPTSVDFQEFVRSLPNLITKTNNETLRNASPQLLDYFLRNDRFMDVPEQMKEVVDLALDQTKIFQKYGQLVRAASRIQREKDFESLFGRDENGFKFQPEMITNMNLSKIPIEFYKQIGEGKIPDLSLLPPETVDTFKDTALKVMKSVKIYDDMTLDQVLDVLPRLDPSLFRKENPMKIISSDVYPEAPTTQQSLPNSVRRVPHRKPGASVAPITSSSLNIQETKDDAEERSEINNETPKDKESEETTGFFGNLKKKIEYLASFGELWMIATFALSVQVLILWIIILVICRKKE